MVRKNSYFDEGSKKPCESKDQNETYQCQLTQGIQSYEYSDEFAGDLPSACVLTYLQAYRLCTLLLDLWDRHNPVIVSSDIIGKSSENNVYKV